MPGHGSGVQTPVHTSPRHQSPPQTHATRTISVDPSKSEDCFRGAKFLHRLLEGLGAEVKLVQPMEGKNPLVIARLGRCPTKPTVTFYGGMGVGGCVVKVQQDAGSLYCVRQQRSMCP